MKIGVSGSGGFVGQLLVERLRRAGHIVVPVVRFGTGAPGEIVTGDLAAPVAPVEVPDLDGFVHLAARTHVIAETDGTALARFRAVNVGGTRAVLDLARRAHARRFLFLSSVKVNGERTRGRAFTEIDPPLPEDAYGQSKLEAEDLIRDRCAQYGIAFTILRPPLVYGAGQKGNLRMLADAVQRGIPLPFGLVRNRRSLVYAGNLADLVAVAVEHPQAANRVLMADDGTILSTPELIRAMASAAGRKARLLPVPPALLTTTGRLTGRGDQMERLIGDLEIDGETTKTLLNWVAPVAPDEAIAIAFAPASS